MGDDGEKVKNEALQIINQHHNLPPLVVFDLDHTLWPYYCEFKEYDMPYLYEEVLVYDIHIDPIKDFLQKPQNIRIPCKGKSRFTYFQEALPILHALKQKGISMAVASRSPTSDVAKSFLQTLGISSFFVTQEIFSSSTRKTDHFPRIHATTGVPLTSMLFFDDKYRNIHAVSKVMG